MKKNYFMLAAAALMFAACAETDFVKDVNTDPEEQAISFDTYAGKLTRAGSENNNTPEVGYTETLFSHHTNFDVWAYKNVSDTKVFDDEVVSNDGSGWTYEGLAYWDKAASTYEFYAAAPSAAYWTLNSNTAAQNDDYFTITSLFTVNANNAAAADAHAYKKSFKGVTNAIDLMIAAPETVNDFSSPVQLDFIHILSRLNITVAKASSLSSKTVTMNSLTFHNINNQGIFDESKASGETLSKGTHTRWTINDVAVSYPALSGETITEKPGSSDAEYMLQSLILPQLAAHEVVKLDGTSTGLVEPYFTINYTITEGTAYTETFEASYNLADAFGITSGNSLAFNEGWQNTLHITIKPTKIEFDGSVATWNASTPGLDI